LPWYDVLLNKVINIICGVVLVIASIISILFVFGLIYNAFGWIFGLGLEDNSSPYGFDILSLVVLIFSGYWIYFKVESTLKNRKAKRLD
jgi:hypothetical protein